MASRSWRGVGDCLVRCFEVAPELACRLIVNSVNLVEKLIANTGVGRKFLGGSANVFHLSSSYKQEI